MHYVYSALKWLPCLWQLRRYTKQNRGSRHQVCLPFVQTLIRPVSHVNGKQPWLCTKRVKSHTCKLRYWENSWSLALVHTSQSCKKILGLYWTRERYSWVPDRDLYKELKKAFVDNSLLITHWRQHFKGKRDGCAVIVYRPAFTWLLCAQTTPPTPPRAPRLPLPLQDFCNSGLKGKDGWLRPWLQFLFLLSF